MYLGYWNSHPDHYAMFSAEDIPGIKKIEELEIA
jgi:hypothetical protein